MANGNLVGFKFAMLDLLRSSDVQKFTPLTEAHPGKEKLNVYSSSEFVQKFITLVASCDSDDIGAC